MRCSIRTNQKQVYHTFIYRSIYIQTHHITFPIISMYCIYAPICTDMSICKLIHTDTYCILYNQYLWHMCIGYQLEHVKMPSADVQRLLNPGGMTRSLHFSFDDGMMSTPNEPLVEQKLIASHPLSIHPGELQLTLPIRFFQIIVVIDVLIDLRYTLC